MLPPETRHDASFRNPGTALFTFSRHFSTNLPKPAIGRRLEIREFTFSLFHTIFPPVSKNPPMRVVPKFGNSLSPFNSSSAFFSFSHFPCISYLCLETAETASSRNFLQRESTALFRSLLLAATVLVPRSRSSL